MSPSPLVRSYRFPRIALTATAFAALSLSPGLILRAQETTPAAATAEAAPVLQAGDLVAVFGDSITEGKRYTVMMEDYLLMCQPAPDLEMVQFGWSGEKSWGVLPRMEAENLPFKPTVATTFYGMNDGGYKPVDPAVQEQYRVATRGIVDKLKGAGVRSIVVGGPGVVDSGTFKKIPAEEYNATLRGLSDVAQEVAEEKGVLHADVHSVMLSAMEKAKAKYGQEFPVAGRDGVHPANNGHLAMAYAFLKALGCDGAIGTITWDYKAGTAEATEGHTVQGVEGQTLKLVSSKYPFCFYGDLDVEDSTRNMEQFLPFNEELNRFILVVRNAPAEGLTLTWGADSKEFTAEQLKNGINLADEFIENNPFKEPFKKVEDLIREQQAYETVAVKRLLNGLADRVKYFPEENVNQEEFTAKVVAKDVEFRQKSRAAVVPVEHTLVLAPTQPKAAEPAATPVPDAAEAPVAQ